jgi:hypothetical protein
MNSAFVNINTLVNKKRFETSMFVEYAEFAVLCLIAAGIPLVVRHPQLFVGVMVNFALMVTAVNMRGWQKIVPLIVLPSIAAAIGGFLFGSFTMYLVYLIPVIWLGNASLVFLMKYLHLQRKVPFIAAVPVASVVKMLILFSVTLVLVFSGVLPSMFLTAMGLMQLLTAIVGGMVAFPVTFGYQHFFQETKQ